MDWSRGYIAVDWGTTNRRAYLIGSDGLLHEKMADNCGVRSLAKEQYPREAAYIRSRLGDLPMLVAGVAGSSRGWHAAPYVECPATMEQLARSLAWIEPGRTAIVPGVCQRGTDSDVMRGEEIQALGAVLAGHAPQGGLICHPGTHAKWIRTEGSSIASFRTAMTGEFFNLLRENSSLGEMMSGAVGDNASFRAGARAGLAGTELLSTLFTVRARSLLGELGGQDAAFVSGLLIGSDVRDALGRAGAEPITLIGEPDLCGLYQVVLGEAGRECQRVDGDAAFVSGIAALVGHLA